MRSNNKRDQILEAALRVVEEKGAELHTVEGDVSLVPEFVHRAVHVSDASSTQILTLAEQ